jgi:uncharacterized protein YjdB
MAKYTDAQIKTVCEAAINSIAGMTDAQNVTFPTTPIIEGMNAGLSAEVIASNARESISDLPLYNNGTYNFIGSSMTIFNIGQILYGAVLEAIKGLSSESQEDPVVTITSVSLNKDTTSIAKGGTETLTATVVASPDEAANKTVTLSLAVANEKVTVVDGVITVANDAEEGEVTVVATSTVDNTKSASCVVTITAE